jgi:uncharacterized protein (DUF1499 family)
MSRFLWLCAVLALLPPAAMPRTVAAAATAVHDTVSSTPVTESFFKTLKRPDSPNHWLLAPADFVAKPDAVAPVFAVPVAALRTAFTAVVQQTRGAHVVAETADSAHVVVSTPVFGFKDDLCVQFIALSTQQSTLALYSASRLGYWDLGTNRRRIEDWMIRLQSTLTGSGP